MEAYRIADEPRPGGLAQYAVSPVWPLFGFMFCGSWLAWPWFILNGIAVGSPTLRREIILAAAGFAGSLLLAYGIFFARSNGELHGSAFAYALLVLTVWKLAISYWLYTLQSRTFGIYEYYGGQVRSGFLPILVASFFLRRAIFKAFDPETPVGFIAMLGLS